MSLCQDYSDYVVSTLENYSKHCCQLLICAGLSDCEYNTVSKLSIFVLFILRQISTMDS